MAIRQIDADVQQLANELEITKKSKTILEIENDSLRKDIENV